MEQEQTTTVKEPLELNARVSVVKLKSASLKGKEVVQSWQYYIIIETDEGEHQINTGEKAYEKIEKLTTKK